MDGLQRLALAQAQVATNQSNQAQQLQQQAYTSSPGNDSTFSGGTLGSLSRGSGHAGPGGGGLRPAVQAARRRPATSPKKANTWWKLSSGTYGKIVVLPAFAKNDLAATVWLNYGSAAQSANDPKTRDQGLRRRSSSSHRTTQRPAGASTILKQLKRSPRPPATTTTTP